MSSIVSLSELLRGGESRAMINTRNKNEILALNEKTKQYGLTLTEAQAKELVITRNNALRENSRVEFGLGAVRLIIETFADSPYLDSRNYAEVINELTDIFYYVKSETDDRISDIDLVAMMKDHFENACGGSLELLMSRDLDELITDTHRKGAVGDHVYRPLSEFFDLDENFNDDDFDPDSEEYAEIDDSGEKDLDYYDYEEAEESEHSGAGLSDGGYGYLEDDDYEDDPDEMSISKFDLEYENLLGSYGSGDESDDDDLFSGDESGADD